VVCDFLLAVAGSDIPSLMASSFTCCDITKVSCIYTVSKKGATDFFAVTFTNIDGCS